MKKTARYFSPLVFALLIAACGSAPKQDVADTDKQSELSPQNINKVYIVDCLLPGQVRRLGSSVNYITPRRPIRTSAIDCEIRGGEYVAFDRADYATALKIWMPKAQEGDPEAQTNVGEIYEKGMGLQPDYEMAAVWYKKAANQGYSRAQINIGYLYEKGLGVEQDLTTAMNWYRKASGLPEEIEFIASVELQSKNEELTNLRTEVDRLQQEADQLKQQLNESQQKLKDTQNRKTSTESEIKQLQQKIKAMEAKAEANMNDTPREVPFQVALQDLHKQLQQREAELRQQGLLIAQLNTQSSDYRTRIAKIQSEQQLALAAPSIEIIEPPIALTRGKPSVILRSISRNKEIFGRINAPAGVKSFYVNNTPTKLESNNTFHISVPVDTSVTDFDLKVIDKRDRTTDMSFSVTIPQSAFANNAAKNQDSGRLFKNVKLGNYYALIIGNNEYKNLPALKSAVNDAKAVDEVLRKKYGFKTKLLINANRYQILSALHELRNSITENDNFLVYYAGHGDLDRGADRGYWMPVDAELDNSANWISNIAVTDMLNTLPAKHVMVVADSCYSGTMTRTAVPRMDTDIPVQVQEKWLQLMAKSRSRTALTSGGLQPVLDEGGGEHSVFAEVFLHTLNKNDGLLQGYALFRRVTDEVTVKSGNLQTPEYAPIKHAGHETGQFFFVPAS